MAIIPKSSPLLGQVPFPCPKEQREGGFWSWLYTAHSAQAPFFPVFSLVPAQIQSWLAVSSSTRHHLAGCLATGFKTAGDARVLDVRLLLGEWDFYEAAAIGLAYRVLKIFTAGWDLLEAPRWNVMEFPIRECPRESGRAWFPGTQRCQRAGFMESNFLSEEKICSRDSDFSTGALPPWV